MTQSQKTILIIDDCQEDRYTYRRYLSQDQSHDYKILEADSGQAALDCCQQTQPDIILLDYLLPDFTGLELLTRLQAQCPTKAFPAILLTGQGSESIAVQAMKLGVEDYLVKGEISAKDLQFAIAAGLEKFTLRLQLRESEERLKLALEAAQMGTWEWQISTNKLIWSDQICTLFGLSPETALPSYEAFLQAVHPDDRAAVDQSLNRTIQDRLPYEIEFRTVWADSSVHWISGRGQLYCDSTGQPLRLVGTAMDITTSKQAEAERLQRIERARLIAQIAQQVHRSLDLNEVLQTTVDQVRQFLSCDRVLIFRLDDHDNGTVITESVQSDCIALLKTDFHDPCFATSYIERYEQGRVMAVADIEQAGLQACHLDLLTKLQVRANLVVPILQDQKLWGLLIAHHCEAPRSWQSLEIGLLKQLSTQVSIAIQQSELHRQEQIARKQAETANRVKDEFLAVLSHELRTPLNSILGWSKMLRMGRVDPGTTQNALATIERNAKLQLQLIEDLLDVSRILQGKMVLTSSPVDLVPPIQDAIETIRLAAEAKQIEIHTKFPALAFQVAGDAGRLQQVVWNLLSNAVKFTPSQGQVEIRLEQSDGMAQIQVIDTGKGIHNDFLPHVFDYFRQEDGTTTRKFGGLGLGLAIVRQIVELHGGTVAVSSNGEGQGATFTVSLPLLQRGISSVISDEGCSTPGVLAGLQILVVDDDADCYNLVAFMLRQEGATVKTVNSAFAALKVLAKSRLDLVISDIGMPELDGYDLIQQVRLWTIEQGGEIPAIALSAHAGEYDQRRAIAAGFQRHLAKPVDPPQLVQTIIQICEARTVK